MTTDTGRILLGEITSVHGIKGEVVIRSYAATPEGIAAYGPLADAGGTRHYEIVPLRSGPKGVVARIKGIEDRSAAEHLRGTKLYVARAALPEPEDEAYYVTDLVGLSAADAAGRAFGKIVAVHNFGAGDIVEVAIDGTRTTELVPFTAATVPDVSIAAGSATIILPPETLDEPPDDAPSNEASDPAIKKGE